MDISEYEPFLKIGFSTPSADRDSEPTFGTMVSCINICLRLLTKVGHLRDYGYVGGGESKHCDLLV